MLIAIVETGAPPEALLRRHGGYSLMVQRMLAVRVPQARFATYKAGAGELPNPGEVDAALITGSPAGVYDRLGWIDPLLENIRAMAGAGRPQVGICFGHQAMATAFGGRVEKSDRGWGVGVHEYETRARPAWMRPAPERFACAVSHQDQVVAAPAGARILAGSDFCPFGALSYAQGPAISFQMHPEFEHDFAADLLRARKERLPAHDYDIAMASFARGGDRALIADWIARFYVEGDEG